MCAAAHGASGQVRSCSLYFANPIDALLNPVFAITRGLDVLIPLSVESYNRYLEAHSTEAASPLTRFKLPVPGNGTKSSHLLVLVGNSKNLWNPFLDFVQHEMQQNDGRVLNDPVDRYVKQTVNNSLSELAACYKDFEDAKVIRKKK